MSQTRIAQILRKTKSLSLRLPQNSRLNIIAEAPDVPVNVLLLPEWRDDGHISLQSIFPNAIEQVGYPKDHLDWKVQIRDDEHKIGLTTVDVAIQGSIDGGLEGDSSSSDDEEITTMEEIDNIDGQKIPEGITLTARIPEKCNVTCKLHHGGNIDVKSKLEGEHGFELMTSGGDIFVQKLRGDSINLDSKFEEKMGMGGTIHAMKSIEAQDLGITVGKGGRFRAKMLNVSNVNIECDDGGEKMTNAKKKIDDDDIGALIDISSIYTSLMGEGAHMVVNSSGKMDDDSLRKVRVKSNHGHISVRSSSSFNPKSLSYIADGFDQEFSHVELGGVNGSFDVSITKLESIAGSKPTCEEDSILPKAAKVHIDSLSPGQASILTSDFGDVNVSLDRKIESDIRILSAPLLENLDPGVLLIEDEEELVDALVDHDKDIGQLLPTLRNTEKAIRSANPGEISMETEAFCGFENFDMDHVKYVYGSVENKSEEPNSRFDVKTKGLSSSVGKISVHGAAGQALHGFSGGTVAHDEKQLIDLPLLAIATCGDVKVETLSWIGAIARRYGLGDESKGVGRQAAKNLSKE